MMAAKTGLIRTTDASTVDRLHAIIVASLTFRGRFDNYIKIVIIISSKRLNYCMYIDLVTVV